MAIWVAIECDGRAAVNLWQGAFGKPVLNEWRYKGDTEFHYGAETEWQAREALIQRLIGKVHEYERVIAIEQAKRLT